MNTEARLRELGDHLEEVFAADLQREARVAQVGSGRGGVRSWLATRRGRWLAAGAVVVIAVPGVAYAAGAFTSPQTVAKSLPAGARIFGSTPTCTVVRPNVEYHCMLTKAPSPDPVYAPDPQAVDEVPGDATEPWQDQDRQPTHRDRAWTMANCPDC